MKGTVKQDRHGARQTLSVFPKNAVIICRKIKAERERERRERVQTVSDAHSGRGRFIRQRQTGKIMGGMTCPKSAGKPASPRVVAARLDAESRSKVHSPPCK